MSEVSSVFFLLKPATIHRMGRRYVGLANRLGSLLPGLKYDLRRLDPTLELGDYVATVVVNSFIWSLFVFLGVAGALAFTKLQLAFIPSLLTFVMLLLFLGYYPKILARNVGEAVDKDLVFALKDLLLQVSSGVSMFKAMANVAGNNYGAVSDAFGDIAQTIAAGEAEDVALEKMAKKSESDFFRKTLWQIVTALRSGSSPDTALRSVIQTLESYQRNQIKTYVQELNLWALFFMIFAVAVPGLGSTILIIMSAFGGANVNETFYMTMLAFAFITQFVVIGFIKAKRPAVYLG